MLYGNNAKKGAPSTRDGKDDFSKNKLVDEAKRIRESREAAQKQQEKSRLQLEIQNKKRELDRGKIDLQAKENKLAEIARKLADAKRAEFSLKGKIKQTEGGTGYLDDEARAHDAQASSHEAELIKVKTKRDTVLAQIAKLKIESEKLDQEYRDLETAVKQVTSKKTQVSRNIQGEKKKIKADEQELMFKSRVATELERDQQIITQEISRLKRDQETKEREVKDLERKRDAIGV